MPARYPPQLGHRSLDWGGSIHHLKKGMQKHGIDILEVAGFFDEYGIVKARCPKSLATFGSVFPREADEANTYLDEIAGILLRAAAIRFDGGFSAAGRIMPTLASIAADPSLVRRRGSHLDPEAVGVLARHYRRGTEEPGTYWFDVSEMGSRRIIGLEVPTAQALKDAAQSGMEQLRDELLPGRTCDSSTRYLACELAQVFGRFGRQPARVVDGDREYGSFHDFVHLLVPLLNQQIKRHRTTQVKPFSATTVLRMAVSRRRCRDDCRDQET